MPLAAGQTILKKYTIRAHLGKGPLPTSGWRMICRQAGR